MARVLVCTAPHVISLRFTQSLPSSHATTGFGLDSLALREAPHICWRQVSNLQVIAHVAKSTATVYRWLFPLMVGREEGLRTRCRICLGMRNWCVFVELCCLRDWM